MQQSKLRPRIRGGALGGFAATAAIGLIRHPFRIRLRDLLVGTEALVIGYVAASGFNQFVDDQAQALAADFGAGRTAEMTRSFDQGRDHVTKLVASAVAQAETRLLSVGSGLDPALRSAAADRIATLRQRVTDLATAGGAAST